MGIGDKDSAGLQTTGHGAREAYWSSGAFWTDKILYFGDWRVTSEWRGHYSNRQYDAFEFCFRGPTVQWIGSKSSSHGHADVYIDGEFQATVDSYSANPVTAAVNFETTGLSKDRVHTLRVVVTKERHPDATDCYQDVICINAIDPVVYAYEISDAMNAEYTQIQNGAKPYLAPDRWTPVDRGACAPEDGVILRPGAFGEAFARNIDYINHCFENRTYCDGVGWSEWLPASNDGRLLAAAGNTLRWGERTDMRAILDTIIAKIEAQMRDDGYFNYYDESDAYVLNTAYVTERKNYDRVFWTRGMLAAGMAGNSKAYELLRKMYDWFNSSPYLPWMLIGGNATNGLPGGPLVYLSPAGIEDDLLVTERYYDQDYWINELTNRQPLCFSHYPGERPHCYLLLGLESFVDEYRATGAQKYIDAVEGGWEIYKNNYKHLGGAPAIVEGQDIYPPKSYYITSKPNGETCGTVFWIDVNSKLLQLNPNEEKFATEIEESIFNMILGNQDEKGYLRAYRKLHGTKNKASCSNGCCEVSASGLIGRMPEFIYSVASDGIYVNLFVSSDITWNQVGDDVSLTTTTEFPFNPAITMKVSTESDRPSAIRIRVPSWATRDMTITVNGSDVASGAPGSYVSLDRTWADDIIEFRLPIGFRTVKYTGLDQVEGNYDRYALMYGPLLMALQGELEGPGGVPRISAAPEDLPSLLTPIEGKPLEYRVEGLSGYRYLPYWQVKAESFTCFPIVQAGGQGG